MKTFYTIFVLATHSKQMINCSNLTEHVSYTHRNIWLVTLVCLFRNTVEHEWIFHSCDSKSKTNHDRTNYYYIYSSYFANKIRMHTSRNIWMSPTKSVAPITVKKLIDVIIYRYLLRYFVDNTASLKWENKLARKISTRYIDRLEVIITFWRLNLL